jgi:hypothetical protein
MLAEAPTILVVYYHIWAVQLIDLLHLSGQKEMGLDVRRSLALYCHRNPEVATKGGFRNVVHAGMKEGRQPLPSLMIAGRHCHCINDLVEAALSFLLHHHHHRLPLSSHVFSLIWCESLYTPPSSSVISLEHHIGCLMD